MESEFSFSKPLDWPLGGQLIVGAEVMIMYIHEAAELSGTTKKAIEYYCLKGLLSPQVTENGYRDFSDEDVACLKRISLLRSLGVCVEDVQELLDGKDDTAIHRIIEKQETDLARKKEQHELLKELAASMDWNEVQHKVDAAKCRQSVTDRLTEAFPGFWGKYLSLHFGRFLQDPVRTQDQENALHEVCDYLDGVQLEVPKELRHYLDEMNAENSVQVFRKADAALSDAVGDPENWLKNHQEIIDQYLEFRKTAEYQNSPGAQLKELIKQFNQEQGYDSIFIPAMRRLSPAYDEYVLMLQKANQIFLEKIQKQKG